MYVHTLFLQNGDIDSDNGYITDSVVREYIKDVLQYTTSNTKDIFDNYLSELNLHLIQQLWDNLSNFDVTLQFQVL